MKIDRSLSGLLYKHQGADATQEEINRNMTALVNMLCDLKSWQKSSILWNHFMYSNAMFDKYFNLDKRTYYEKKKQKLNDNIEIIHNKTINWILQDQFVQYSFDEESKRKFNEDTTRFWDIGEQRAIQYVSTNYDYINSTETCNRTFFNRFNFSLSILIYLKELKKKK